ncbi:MAG: tRNA (cytidine(34)-2'-O)-methyltransferase [Nitrospirota bacterium]|nr:tRNA (cytidine(34)-2'-O)-methyltransferase [Nitrospirota bacterium]
MHIVLHEPEIPGNTGNIARLCVGADVDLHLVGKLGFRIDDKAVKRAGLDYWPNLRLHLHNDLDQLWASAGDSSRFFYLTTKTDRLYTAVTYQSGDYLVLGRETSGLPEWLLKANAERCITIPMPGPVRSLNLSNAASIVLYEALRQSSKW